ncbi:3,4-dihydroxy-9,10-secoandrosta-1,3,5(10)-triene-9,17-dione 4,5-dioxygenase [Rhodococcus sp. LBL1]|uniref:3,4-dihydroxy-9,10-secoandrosta-1,3, 5(10)-triene-9,17-dione 4,5-dioxygenase n=1 Tax=Prescottella agglutinans TaxID=1644129 RepID=A0ABT6M7F3_9NOCA|nr:biphenyl-2,3-diol 1,2-dioxygenase [Prescottella agglutinans]MDH6280208.1 3,4-dihydroxy-9,10-secoandrosta-1,3,5(10)-triene-9,17-dione 4,5-dioxygenase [Prescottella agglutinans]MDH6676978.1 3,4-dihydroxy-9,10-secoandrosta-1,3,5(10)-triene-9,17-dione 4,5-dioxygenase [Rhodococcus sp. LBL1]MDH6682729.1 3,4-dihydroxy-9,10-secoandrosta-1,3,5(10)-triene-9,17-dione 4,5-dioxygenase [Rhodococcus sp. LBL2]
MTDIRGLGYLRIQTQDIARWRELVVDGLGMAIGSGPEPDGLYLRLDERRARLIVLPGESDKALAVGWEVRDQFALQRVREAVEKAGIAVEELSLEEADYRDAEKVIAFDDPAGTRVEVFFGPVLDHSPVVTPHGGQWVTGPQGLGHVVLPSAKFAESYAFYTEVLGFLPRGAIRLQDGVSRVRFLGVNQRHHSLALCPAPPTEEPGLVHLMTEVSTLDAVGQALDRVAKLGFTISSTLGRHTNDKMVSFYVRAPGGWDLEFGTEGMLVDETFYTAEEITADSYWGHDWSASEPLKAFIPKA